MQRRVNDAFRFMGARSGAGVRGRLAFVAFVGGYLGLVAWFKIVDVYHTQFAKPGALIVAYNFFRVLFIFYLFWMVQWTGIATLRWIAGEKLDDVRGAGRLALGFFAGTGIWHFAMLGLGFLDLYTVPVAVILTLPVVALSFREVEVATSALERHFDRKVWFDGPHRAQAIVALGALLMAASALADLLVVKGLFPGGGHDYYTHYFYYFQTVIDRGGLWPNDVWYHFYYCKGAGLHFLGILLTDPLAPQLVTFCYIAAAALVVFKLLQRVAPSTLWPWAGVTLFLVLYIYTPGPNLNRAHGGWGDFEKMHELHAALIIAVIWLSAGALERTGKAFRAWFFATASAMVAAVIITSSVAVFLVALFSLAASWLLATRQWRSARTCMAWVAIACIALGGVLSLNYLATGLINDQGILWFWPFADLDKLDRWGALLQVMMLHLGTMGLVANSVPLSSASLAFIVDCLRLDMLFPLVVTGVLIAVIAVAARRARLSARYQTLLISASLTAFCAVALLFGRAQPISFYRYSSFALPITIAAGVMLWRVPRGAEGYLVRTIFNGLVPVMILLGCLAVAYKSYPAGAFKAVHHDAWRFVRGHYSIDDAYTHQQAWPGRLAWGGIHPGARGAYAAVGPRTPIWSMHIHSYCMLPDCRMESYVPFILTPQMDRLLFGTPQEGQAALQAAGTNYFLFSRELAIFDVLPLAPLFAPDNITRHLGIRWTDGKTALLTWLGPGVTPLDEGWVADYRRTATESTTVQSFPYAAMQRIYMQLRATPHPWRPFKLPWG